MLIESVLSTQQAERRSLFQLAIWLIPGPSIYMAMVLRFLLLIIGWGILSLTNQMTRCYLGMYEYESYEIQGKFAEKILTIINLSTRLKNGERNKNQKSTSRQAQSLNLSKGIDSLFHNKSVRNPRCSPYLHFTF